MHVVDPVDHDDGKIRVPDMETVETARREARAGEGTTIDEILNDLPKADLPKRLDMPIIDLDNFSDDFLREYENEVDE